MNYKETILYFTKVNLNKKNLDKLKKNFNLISLNSINQIKKKKNYKKNFRNLLSSKFYV